MSKYKIDDKVVMEITDKISVMEEPVYILSGITAVYENNIDKAAEPLSKYTEPLEAKIRRQAAEITRLLDENKELKENLEKAKIVNLNAGRLAGQKEAWELARKIASTAGGLSSSELVEIFNAFLPRDILSENTYLEAAAKVEAWEKAKEEIKVGDIFQDDDGNNAIVTSVKGNTVYYMWDDGDTRSGFAEDVKKHFTKTGRHIYIDSFLKQIRGEQE